MIALDASVLVHYLLQDNRRQSDKANRLIKSAFKRHGCRGHFAIGIVTLCELARVLRDAYAIPKDQIVEVLDRILATPQFVIQNRPALNRALNAYCAGKGDFADYVNANTTPANQETVTFNRALRGAARYRVM
jgi:predicted nucleic-acid-binding protein